MATMRVNKTSNYTVMSNHHLRDKNLSLKAIGLLSKMLSLPENWDYSIGGLVSICKEGRPAVESALKELKEHGYLVVTKVYPDKTKTGKIEYIYDVYEIPQATCKQGVENQGVGFLPLENIPLYKDTDKSSKDEQNKEERNKEKKTSGTKGAVRSDSEVAAVIESYTSNADLRFELMEFAKMRKRIRRPLTKRAIEILLNDKTGLDSMASTDMEKLEIVQLATSSSWQKFYPIKKNKAGNSDNMHGDSGFDMDEIMASCGLEGGW